jgi:putative nucleotidyltransferase with HDIG domain
MAKEISDVTSRVYQLTITIAGSGLWCATAVLLTMNYGFRDLLTIFALVPLVVIISMFPNTIPLPSSLRFSPEKLTLTLSDSFILLVACWHGIVPAIFIAGIEGFASSRRAVRRPSSNLFSFGMMTLAAGAAAGCLQAVLRYGFNEVGFGRDHGFTSVAVALLVASIVHIVVNTGLLSVLLALRHKETILPNWEKNFLWAAPMFLPTGTAATLMYFALRYDALIMLVIGGPILIAIYMGHRQYRASVQERINITEKAHRETIEALAVAINAKDEVTHEHVLRVQIYAAGVARLLGCNDAEVEALRAGALLHDIGKIAVPDYVLNKPGKLTAAEFETMKSHTIIGAQILGRVEFPYPVVPVVRHHHERWDGRGYPDGLKGEDIPLTARILSVVDCFDAVREDRQYRMGMTREQAINLIMEGSGTQYDPRVVGTFLTHLPQFEAEIQAHRDAPLPTFGIEPVEKLSEAARKVAPAAGLAEEVVDKDAAKLSLSHKELRALYDLAQAVNGASSRGEIINVFTEKLGLFVPYDTCAITLVVQETGESITAHAAGRYAELLQGRNVKPGEGVTGWVLANCKPFCNTDPKLDVPPAHIEKFKDYRTMAAFPIMKETEMHGAISLYSASLDSYNADHQKLLLEAASLVAVALAANSKALAPETTQRPASDLRATPQTTSVFKTTPLKIANTTLESDLAH